MIGCSNQFFKTGGIKFPKITQYLDTSELETSLQSILEASENFTKSKNALNRIIQPNIKYVLNTLKRAAKNTALITRLNKKINRFDSDTIQFLGLEGDTLPSVDLIKQRIAILENYRKLRGNELERYHCAILKLIYCRYGKPPLTNLKLRNFVVACLDFAGIDDFPDPAHHGDLLDDWINTDISAPDHDIHNRAATWLIKNQK